MINRFRGHSLLTYVYMPSLTNCRLLEYIVRTKWQFQVLNVDIYTIYKPDYTIFNWNLSSCAIPLMSFFDNKHTVVLLLMFFFLWDKNFVNSDLILQLKYEEHFIVIKQEMILLHLLIELMWISGDTFCWITSEFI